MKNNQPFNYLLVAFSILLWSCEVETETEEPVKEITQIPAVERPKPKRIDPAKFTSYLERKYMPQAKLFGVFFQDRMQFHIVDEPDLTLYKQDVNELTFYHIDEELCKKKFIMGGDISESLIYTLGNFKMKPLDSVTTAIAKAGPIIIRQEGRRYLNSAFRNFELKWEKEGRLIRYLAESDSLGMMSYTYSEEDPDYKFMLKALKYGIKIQEEEAEIMEEVL
ncbi:MAG: hypothetical protein R8G66_34810 [Cytophagales bacterium]|nr:hypothetical protein [Cytophagales bacterium]